MRISPGVPLRASANAIVLERALTLNGGAIGEEVAPIQTLVLAEFVGTFILLLAVLMSARAPDWALRPIQLPVLTTLGTLIYFFGPVSGALLNPAVSLSFVVKGEMPLSKFALFSASQMLGAAAATMCHGIFPDALHMPLARWRSKLSAAWWSASSW